MADFKVTNLYDGVEYDADFNELVELWMPAAGFGRGVLVDRLTEEPLIFYIGGDAPQIDSLWTLHGDQPTAITIASAFNTTFSGATGDPGDPYDYPVTAWALLMLDYLATGEGVLDFSLSNYIEDKVPKTLRLRIHVQNRHLFAAALPWLPAGLIDLQFDLDARKVRSSWLAERYGFSGIIDIADPFLSNPITITEDDHLTFAVVPVLGGEFVAADISAISLTLTRRAARDDARVTFEAASVAVVGVDPEQYYVLDFDFTGTGFEVRSWFVNAQDAQAPGTPPLERVELLAQLSLTLDDEVRTSRAFPVFAMPSIAAS